MPKTSHSPELLEIALRPLEMADIPRLPQIRPTYHTSTTLEVHRTGIGLAQGWQLTELQLITPYDKGRLYDFDEDAQTAIRQRASTPDQSFQRVAVHEERLVGLLEVELQEWNNTAQVSNLMIDLDYRRQGLGRRLWHLALGFARQEELRAIMIETQNTNPAACRFYLQMGCELVGFNEALYTNQGQNKQTHEIALFWAYFI